jgi:hypothetical protein
MEIEKEEPTKERSIDPMLERYVAGQLKRMEAILETAQQVHEKLKEEYENVRNFFSFLGFV